jgi:hypothetical protein
MVEISVLEAKGKGNVMPTEFKDSMSNVDVNILLDACPEGKEISSR